VLDALTYAGNLANLAAAHRDPRFRFIRGSILDRSFVEEFKDSSGNFSEKDVIVTVPHDQR